LQAAAATAEHGSLLRQLHAIVDQLHEFYPADSIRGSDAERLQASALRLWQRRDAIVNSRSAGDPRLPMQVKDDLAELAIFWADLHVACAQQVDRQTAALEAMETLEDAERLTGATVVLCREQERLAKLLDDPELAAKAAEKADSLQASSPWEHYALGRMAFAAGDFERADGHFLAALDAEPKDLWSNFYHGRAAYELKQYEEAVSAFAVCVALAHQAPEWQERRGACYHNRGLAYLQLSHPEAARRDFDRALDLNPGLAAVSLERGMLSYQEHRYDEALADLKRASGGASEAPEVAYGLALVFAAQGDRTAALRHLGALFALQPDHEGGKKLAETLRDETE
jgi:tetratricopeptide (TPR) repeat protein